MLWDGLTYLLTTVVQIELCETQLSLPGCKWMKSIL